MRIGHIGCNHNIVKQVICHNYPDMRYSYTRDKNNLELLFNRKTGRSTSKLKDLKLLRSRWYWPRCHMLHLWNQVIDTETPWVTSTSIGLPFVYNTDGDAEYIRRRALELMSRASCKQIICTSEFALEKQCRKSKDNNHLIEKACLLRPPQDLYVVSAREKNEDTLKLVFVGHDFWRKGGQCLIRAVDALRSDGANVHLTVVSELRMGGCSGGGEVSQVKESMSDSDAISWIPMLPHSDVIALLKNSDVAVLPSINETYGYFVLEAQACGCPVITTDINAFPEINPISCGWQLSLSGALSEDYREIEMNIDKSIQSTVEGILSDRSVLVKKSQASLDRIKSMHSPEEHARELRSIYLRSLS